MGGLAASPRRTNDTKPEKERKNRHETEPRNAWPSRTHGPSGGHESYRTPPRGGDENDSRLSCPEGLSRPFVFGRRPRPHSVRRNAAFSVSRGSKLPRPTYASDEFHLQPAQVPTGKRRGPRQRRLGGAGSSRQRPCTCKRSRAFQEWNPNGRPPNVSCAAQFSHKAKRAASSRDANEIRRT